uniref:Uncharacterized protein n=1 Tax=Rhizophora mucronata TaxID=61149 RepID=A0A2P2NID3_RHIMU
MAPTNTNCTTKNSDHSFATDCSKPSPTPGKNTHNPILKDSIGGVFIYRTFKCIDSTNCK